MKYPDKVNEHNLTEVLELFLEQQTSRSARIWEILLKGSLPLVASAITGLMLWMRAQEVKIQDHESRIVHIEKTNFTVSDGFVLQREVTSELGNKLELVSSTMATVVAELRAVSVEVRAVKERLDREGK